MVTQGDFVRTIEAIYDVDQTSKDWLASVLESSRPWLDAGDGVFGCLWKNDSAGLPMFEEFANINGPPVVPPTLGQSMPVEIGRLAARSLGKTFHGFMSRAISQEESDFFNAPLRPFGIVDNVILHGRDLEGRGICIGNHLRRPRAPLRGEGRLLARLARHLAAGQRLRRQLDGRAPTDADASAILTPAGRVEHATDGATNVDTRAALRAAVLAMDRARGAARRTDPEGAVRLWRVLADARFSLVDRFESDGRRYVVACENAPARDGAAELTPRERQVVALYRVGADAKMIAYELGLAHATVRVLLSRAARRVGVATPRALRAVGDM
jgi:DNA-binding CsgD family transcriptional regulator